MDSHLTSQSSTIFRSVHSLIYIFDAESNDLTSSDTHYFLKCLNALRDQNPVNPEAVTEAGVGAGDDDGEGQGPTVFVLLHKMDLVPEGQQASKLAEFEADVTKRATDSGWRGNLQFYGTSIWNETLYKASPSSSHTPASSLTLSTTGLVHRHRSPDAFPLLPSVSSLAIPRAVLGIGSRSFRANNVLGHLVSDIGQ